MIKDKILKLNILIHLSISFSASAAAETINIDNPNWAPYFINKNENRGYIHDFINTCISSMGYTPKFKNVPINRMFKLYKNGDLDINVMSKRRLRKDFAHYSEKPIFTAKMTPFSLRQNRLKISKTSDLNNYRLGHKVGLRYSKEFLAYINRRLDRRTIEVVNSQIQNLKMLIAGRIDVFVGETKEIYWLANQLGIKHLLKQHDYTIKESNYYLTISKKSKNIKFPLPLLKDFNSCHQRMIVNGELEQLRKKYSQFSNN